MSSFPVDVFYSYSHKDERLQEKLEEHLTILEKQGIIKGWHDRKILPSSEWKEEIDDHLNKAHIILLLVSPSFIASDYCYGVEMKRAMERHLAKEARVIPIILRPVAWHNTPFSKLQALPRGAKPVVEWRIRDAAFLSITEGIQDMAEELRGFLSFSQSDNTGRLEKIRRQLDEFYRPIYVRRQRDARSWIFILGLKEPEESVKYKLAKVIERDFVLPNHEEVVGIVKRSRHLIEGDTEMCEVLEQYLQHITVYKDLRASGDETRFPFEVNAPFPPIFDELIQLRIKSLEMEELQLVSTRADA